MANNKKQSHGLVSFLLWLLLMTIIMVSAARGEDRALLIGVAQGFAILPGISRSGFTIATALWAGVPRAEAARFSFLLSIPAVGGALVLQLMDGQTSNPDETLRLLLAGLTAFAIGLLAIRWTALAVVQAHFWKFSFYCLFVGVVVLLILG